MAERNQVDENRELQSRPRQRRSNNWIWIVILVVLIIAFTGYVYSYTPSYIWHQPETAQPR